MTILIHYGPVYERDIGDSTALCRPAEWAVMTIKRDIVTCPQCLALLQPRPCAVCQLEHGREVEHAT